MNAEASLPSPPSKPERIHLPQLDVLRAIAIVMVVCFHSLAVFRRDGLPWRGAFRDYQSGLGSGFLFFYPATFGGIGVSLFFVLSGFVIHLSVLQGKKFDWVQFYSRRFWRIYPAYLVALAAFALWKSASWNQVVTHLFMVHNVSAQTYFGINPAFWSLAVEVQFYLLYPLLFWLRGKVGIQKAFWFSVVLSMCIRLAFLMKGESGRDALFGNGLLLNGAVTPVLWMDWVLGALIAERFLQNRIVFPKWVFWLTLLLAVVSTQIRYTTNLSFSLFSIASAVVVERLVRMPVSGKQSLFDKAMVTIGLLSYSLYLWHQPLMIVVEYQIGRRFFGDSPALLYFVVLFGTLIVATVIAYLSYHFVEKPGVVLGNRVWDRFHHLRNRAENARAERLAP